MKAYNANFAHNLKWQLIMNQMNQSELAARMGVTAAAVSDWCSGEKSPRTLEVFGRLCDVLNCSMIDLVGEPTDLPEGAIPLIKVEKRALNLAKVLQMDPKRLPLVESLLKIPDEDLAKVAAVIAVFVQEEDPNEEA